MLGLRHLTTVANLVTLLALYLRLKHRPLNVVKVSSSFTDSYDYIIVGSGSGGSPLAARLSEDPNTRVLLLEAGGLPTLLSEIPLVAYYLQKHQLDWNYTTVPQSRACFHLKNRQNPVPRGFVLGGSSGINFNLYVRGHPMDYERWEQLGVKGWSWKDVLPYYLKLENQTDPNFLAEDPELHGRNGPINIETIKYVSPITRAFLKAGELMGIPTIKLNGHKHIGFTLPQGTTRNGFRCGVAKAYLRPASFRPNIDILINAFVTKIIFDKSKTARQVQFDKDGQTFLVSATREIIISAGVINTPKLLMLSGVGPANHLKSFGIPIVADRPGVGENMMEHVAATGLHFTVNKHTSLYLTQISDSLSQYLGPEREGPFRVLGGVEALGFIKSKYGHENPDYPDIEYHFTTTSPNSEYASFRNMNYDLEVINTFYKPYLNKEAISFYPVILHPRSRGTVKLVSRNPYTPPAIDPHYLENPHDLNVLTDALQIAYRLGTSEPMRKLGSKVYNISMPGCENLIKFSEPYFRCVVKQLTMGIYHPMGTCKMGRINDPMAVVDSTLRVIGVHNLRVVDASVFPGSVSGNLNVPTIMTSEKAADMIKNEV